MLAMADNDGSTHLTIDSTLPLYDSPYQIPLLGFGVYLSSGPTCTNSCLQALQAGYRHIDTAQYYDNEVQVGRAIRRSRIPRSQLFITSKILSPGKDVDCTYKLIKDSVTKLGADGEAYYDLFLIHSPNGGRNARGLMWAALEEAKESGIVRDIGVSNYGIGHIEEMKEYARVWPPVVNQIEVSKFIKPKISLTLSRMN
jgi:diketogulonate reductase-like aldo/keto reductase